MNLKRLFCRCRNREENSIDYETVKMLVNKGAILIDVRSRQEYKEGHLRGSINISLYDLDEIDKIINDKNKTIILYCEYGKRSRLARQVLIKKGYYNVYTLKGGITSI